MANISPFTALRYDIKKVRLSKVVCPPYDVINRRQRQGYVESSPYNVVRLVLPESSDGKRDYNRAKEDLRSWIEKGILKEEKAPAVYIYLQEYKADKKVFGRYGILALLKLEDKKRNKVLPHENVFLAPLIDRVRLMKKTKAHLSPIFIVYQAAGSALLKLILSKVKNAKPQADINFEGTRNKLWVVTDKSFIKKLTQLMNRGRFFIADGHHRFQASLMVRDYFSSLQKSGKGRNGHNYTLAYIVSSEDKGLKILPTYRAVKVLPDNFSMEYILKRLNGYFRLRFIHAGESQEFLHNAAKKGDCAFVIFYNNRYLSLYLKDKHIIKKIGPKGSSHDWKKLDVSILHNLVFAKLLDIKERINSCGNIYYYKDEKEVIEKVKAGEHKLAVFLNPARIEEVERIAGRGERMPHKSTYFYPKPLTGLVIHRF